MIPFAITKTPKPMTWMEVQKWLNDACKDLGDYNVSQEFRIYMMVIAEEVTSKYGLDIEDWLNCITKQQAIDAYQSDDGSRIHSARVAHKRLDRLDQWWADFRMEVMENTDEYIEASYATHLFLDDFKQYMREKYCLEMREWTEKITPSEFSQMFWDSPKLADYISQGYTLEASQETLAKYQIGAKET